MAKGLLLALFVFFLFLVVHVLAFRVWSPEHRFKVMVRLAAGLGLALLLTHRLTPPDLWVIPGEHALAGWAVDLLNGLLVFSFLFVGYSMFYFLVDRGFSGRIMIEIEAAPQRRLRREDIAARYSLEMVLLRRLNEMREIGRVVLEDGRYRNTHKGASAAALFAFVKRLLRLGEGG